MVGGFKETTYILRKGRAVVCICMSCAYLSFSGDDSYYYGSGVLSYRGGGIPGGGAIWCYICRVGIKST